MQLTIRHQKIIDIVDNQEMASISDIKSRLQEEVSIPTLNRDLAALLAGKCLIKVGKGRATSY